MDEPDEYIDFMAKYKDWISIKRLGIRQSTTPQEIVYHLAGIRSTVDNKAYFLLGIKTQPLDKYAEDATRGTRKSAAALSVVASKFAEPGARQAVLESCERKELTPLAEIYLLGRMITGVGYDTSINQSVMASVFPELKPPKGMRPAGRKRKQGAEAQSPDA